MRRLKCKLTGFLLAIAILFNMAMPASAATTSEFGKLLDSYSADSGKFTLSETSRFYIVADEEPVSDLLETVQLAEREYAAAEKPNSDPLAIAWGPGEYTKSGDIVVKLDSTLAAEAYRLNVSDIAIVSAADCNGLLYGFRALLKNLRSKGGNSLEAFTAEDVPDTKERTVMLDCGRKYYTKEWICNFIREMSWMGYNTLELHFSEDGGFRMDFWDPVCYTENYNPENDFTWICGSKVQSWVGSGYANDPDAGKYLSASEIIDILKTAEEYHIDIIPSFDTPAHMDYLCWKFEQNYSKNTGYSFTYGGRTYRASDVSGKINYKEVNNGWPYYTTIDITQDVAKAFVFQLYSDIADFFREYAGSSKFAIGCDEVNLNYSPKWTYNEFPDYVNDLDNLLVSKGYTTRMFNDFIGTTKYSATKGFNQDIEIIYWNSPFNSSTGATNTGDNQVQPASYFVNSGRTIYNAIQTNCYYVLRVADTISSSNSNYMKDARDPSNTNWSFYHSTEDRIYNEWYSANVNEHGLYSENVAEIPEENLGGAYFLVWNDYAALNTESQVWNGIDSSGTYNIIDRMWSNTIKMWNWDIDDSLTYNEYAAIRDKLGYFPGYISCSREASLPEAKQPVRAMRADHSELEAVLNEKPDAGSYTSESYAVYEKAYEAAVLVNKNYDATQEEIAGVLDTLLKAKESLVERGKTLIVEYKAMVNGAEYTVKPAEVYELAADGKFDIYLEAVTGFPFLSVDGANYVPLSSGSSTCGNIVGSIKKDGTVTVWFENQPFITYLEDLLNSSPKEQGEYTTESWENYELIRAEAVSFCEKMQTAPPADITQNDVDELVDRFSTAKQGLVINASLTEIISIEKLAASVRLGNVISLRIKTTPDVSSLTVDGQTLLTCSGSVQTLNTGDTVKVWLVRFKSTQKGTISYTICTDNGITESVDVIVN